MSPIDGFRSLRVALLKVNTGNEGIFKHQIHFNCSDLKLQALSQTMLYLRAKLVAVAQAWVT